jgi:transcriptional regulator with XRE-family HTH domain
MGRKSVTIPINSSILKAAILSKGWTLELVGEYFNISRQAVNSWFMEERIHPRRLSDLVQKLDLPLETVKEVCDKQDSIKDYARELNKFREENERLKKAIEALLGA